MNPSLDDLKRLEKESQHLYDNAHDDMSDYFKDVLELIFTHERLIQSHEQLQKRFDEAVRIIKVYSEDYIEMPNVEIPFGYDYVAMMRPNRDIAKDFLRSLDKEKK